MSRFQFFTRLNSAERRFVIFVAFILFVAANWLWVWPHFSDLSNYRGRLNKAHDEFGRRQTVIDESKRLEVEMAKLLREGGGGVLPEDQSIQFYRTIQSQATQSGVNLVSNSRLITSTNDPFFTEQVQNIVVAAGEKQLVDFLYNLGLGNSQIRVRALSVRPDTPRQQLNANITLVANYKKDPKRAQASAAPALVRPTTPATKPGVTPSPIPGTRPATSSVPVVPKPIPPAPKSVAPSKGATPNKK